MEAARAGAAGRVRSVDAYRGFAVAMVVIGHWLAFALFVQDGRLSGTNLLEIWPPAHWLTWGFQVMPVFFLVGGYASTASWNRRAEAVTPLAWIGARLWRLLLPTLVLLATVTTAAVLARLAGADARMLDLALTVVGLPLWFLAVYVCVVPLTPLLVSAQRRWRLGVPSALLGGVVVVDVLHNHGDVPVVGLLAYPLFWIGVYALGICWRAGVLPGRRWVPGALLVGGLLTLVLLVGLGPYPVSMVAAAGEPVQNNGPPSVALLALALAQTGVALLLVERVERWCARPSVWRVVVGVNQVAMSLYLWHMVAGVVAAVLVWQVGLVAVADPPSAGWWLWRPVWYAVCAGVLTVLVRGVRRFERPVRPRPAVAGSTPARVSATVLGVLAACAGMVQLTVSGLGAGPSGLPVLGLAGFAVGVGLLVWSTGLVAASSPVPRAPRSLR